MSFSIAGIVLAVMAVSLGVGAAVSWSTSAYRQSQWTGPLPALSTIETCQNADMQSEPDSTFRFHRDRCWADVTTDDKGTVTAFEPYDAAICEQILAGCR